MLKITEPSTYTDREEALLAHYYGIKADGQPEPMARARAWMVSLPDEDFDIVCRGLNARVRARISEALAESMGA